MKLHFDPVSTSSRSVTFFLFDQGISFEERIVSLNAGEQRAPDFLRLNPNGLVPVLEDGDFHVTQSATILRYLADRHAPATLPSEARARGRVNEALDWFSTGFYVSYCVFLAYRRMLPPLQAMPAEGHLAMEGLGQAMAAKYLAVLDRHMLGESPYVCGTEVSVADYLGFAHVTLGEYLDFDLSPYPRVADWVRRMKARRGYDPAYATFRGFVQAARVARAAQAAPAEPAPADA
ncbi:glutathione S-transferase family protein [Muricoccus pecuniae]|uniref:Glutathione S-transferase n=1 Tax=Muricoccus pecuniae TaxID=693023 RepID=A0A840Y4E0_9PROT|nr:glutathione S-transferase family protein [Roseomonas pecuniae]MBB5695595.1 glutathione S-transferase [Roseomonas pecuniae]